ncbi:DNA polymerase III epsilon subunit [Candidatus Nasuia deltocephalinicola]|nr:DNA polymerase III epsilon subunit [Candidatus Nasuia deltocephalinicola]
MFLKKIILDIETTGLNINEGDRIIEICCIEFKNRSITKNIFHEYINPDNKIINKEAYKIHGLSNFFLKDKPFFVEISQNFLNFISNSVLIIHNSEFDLSFINFELKKIGLKDINFYCKNIIDTLKIARKLFPGKRNSLDFLAKRFKINYNRNFHSAIKDVKLLSKIYYYLTIRHKYLSLKKIKSEKYYEKNVSKNIILPISKKDSLRHNLFLKKYIK